MNTNKSQAIITHKIQLLSSFKEEIRYWFEGQNTPADLAQYDFEIKDRVKLVRSVIMETSCLKLMPTLPPALTGGLVIRDCDPFQSIFSNSYFEASFLAAILEMIDQAIAVLESPRYLTRMTRRFRTKNALD